MIELSQEEKDTQHIPVAIIKVVGVGGAGGGSPFSFAPPPVVMKPVKMDDKKFDFVKDAMQTAGSKK